MEYPVFIGRVIIEGEIEVKTGLHIGGPKEVLEVGGVDLPVIKDPFGVPYIPGSSLKGKMRALLELKDGKGTYNLLELKDGKPSKLNDQPFKSLEEFWKSYSEEKQKGKKLLFEGKPCTCGICEICRLFGVPANEKENSEPLNPTRLIVKDAFLDEEKFKKDFENAELLEFDYSEVKYENSIDRLTSTANPRQVERVPAGAIFNFSMSVKLLREEDLNLLGTLLTGMRLLEDDYLGGHGSRGYGAIKFKNIKFKFRGRSFYEGKEEEREISSYDCLSKVKDEEIIKRILEGKSEGK